MDAITIIFVGAILVLVSIFIGRQLTTRKQQTPVFPPGTRPAAKKMPETEVRNATPTRPAAPVIPKAVAVQETIDLDKEEIVRLRLRLINCFGGNRAAMERTISFEWGKFSHLSEKDLLEKMLYDFGRKR